MADEASSSAKSLRHICRSLRLTRFRVTAFPTRLDTTKPTCVFAGGRVMPSALDAEVVSASRACTTTVDPPARTPLFTVEAKSAVERSLAWAASTLGRQDCATLAAACGKNCTSCAGTHPRAETMLARTATIARLVSALAHDLSPLVVGGPPCEHDACEAVFFGLGCRVVNVPVPCLGAGLPRQQLKRLSNVRPSRP